MSKFGEPPAPGPRLQPLPPPPPRPEPPVRPSFLPLPVHDGNTMAAAAQLSLTQVTPRPLVLRLRPPGVPGPLPHRPTLDRPGQLLPARAGPGGRCVSARVCVCVTERRRTPSRAPAPARAAPTPPWGGSASPTRPPLLLPGPTLRASHCPLGAAAEGTGCPPRGLRRRGPRSRRSAL